MTVSDGKQYLTDVIDEDGINLLLGFIPKQKNDAFLKRVKGIGNAIDEKSKEKAPYLT